ncbi:MAG: DUF456 domain-containing protein [Candidatus Dojkabacteria bacterium]|nr:DUF456 domain-containing protein [Candidatus Dojkabacteria bacterium]
MDFLEIFIYILAGILVVSGTVASIMNFPGIWLVLLGYVLSGFASGWERFSVPLIVAVAIVSVISSLLDNVMSLALSKKFGATRWGLFGAFLGSLFGLLVAGLVGMIAGSFIGAFVAELIIMKRAVGDSAKSGAGAVLGWFVGMVMKFAIAAGLLVLWFVIVL